MLQLKKKKKEKKKKKKKHKFIDDRGSTIVYNGLVKFNLFSTIVLLVWYISCVFFFFFLKIGWVGFDLKPTWTKADPNIGPEPDPSIHSTRPRPFGSGGPGGPGWSGVYLVLIWGKCIFFPPIILEWTFPYFHL